MDNDNIITLFDEEENRERDFEVIITLEVDNEEYAILLPVDEDTEEGLVFEIVQENGEEFLEYVSDDAVIDKVAKAYEELMEDEE